MTIISRDKVRAAYKRALDLQNDREAAVLSVAQALALPVEAVAECLKEEVTA